MYTFFLNRLKTHIYLLKSNNQISSETGCLDSIPRLLVIKSDIFLNGIYIMPI